MIFTHESQYVVGSAWPNYFWNRGIEIDKCEF
jgi:hypothetical protein